jgi:hypothetical protein
MSENKQIHKSTLEFLIFSTQSVGDGLKARYETDKAFLNILKKIRGNA